MITAVEKERRASAERDRVERMSEEEKDIHLREVTERLVCPACIDERVHSGAEWAHHPYAGTGRAKGDGHDG